MAELSLNTQQTEKAGTLSLTTDIVTTSEVSEEFSLPDYVPKIKRILHVCKGVLPESKYISDSADGSLLEMGGTVTYLVIYTDDDGKLCSLPLTSAYETKANLTAHPTEVQVDTVADSVTCRVTAPRKITLKTRLKSKIRGWESQVEEEKIEGKSAADELFMERQTKNVNTVSMKQFSLGDIRISDQIDTHGYRDLRPVWCDAAVVIKDTRVQNGGVSIRGEARIKCVCQGEEEIVTLTKTAPIAEEIPADGASLGDGAVVFPRCVSLAISNEQSEGDGQLFFDLVCEIDATVLRSTEATLVTDCYSTKYETSEEHKMKDVYSLVKAQCSTFTVNEGVKLKSKEISRVIDVICDPVYEKTEFKGAKAITTGKLCISVIGVDETGREYSSEEYEIPFKSGCDMGKQCKDGIVRCSLSPVSVTAQIEGEKLLVSAEIYEALEIIEKNQLRVLDSAILKKDKEVKRDAGCVRVYFPKEGDTLWEIAKKYHVTAEQLKQQNAISTAELSNVKNLII